MEKTTIVEPFDTAHLKSLLKETDISSIIEHRKTVYEHSDGLKVVFSIATTLLILGLIVTASTSLLAVFFIGVLIPLFFGLQTYFALSPSIFDKISSVFRGKKNYLEIAEKNAFSKFSNEYVYKIIIQLDEAIPFLHNKISQQIFRGIRNQLATSVAQGNKEDILEALLVLQHNMDIIQPEIDRKNSIIKVEKDIQHFKATCIGEECYEKEMEIGGNNKELKYNL